MSEFSSEQYGMAYHPSTRLHYWHLARNRIIERHIRSISTTKKPVLEIGCGPGFVVEHLRQCGFECKGVELAEIAPLPNLRTYVESGLDFTELSENERDRYEVVLLLDVIEHIKNDAEFLSTVAQSFASLKYLVLSVPARMEIWSNYDDYYGHFRRYDTKSLENVLGQAGFHPVHIRYGFHLTYLAALFLTTMGIQRKIRVTVPNKLTFPLHRALAVLFRIETIFVPSSFRGSSLFAVPT